MSDELTEMRVRIAGDMMECPVPNTEHTQLRDVGNGRCDRCGLTGSWLADFSCHDQKCSECKATPGRVHRFGDALRTTCERCLGKKTVKVPVWESGWCPSCEQRNNNWHIHPCTNCQGRGWVPAGDFMPKLLKELDKAGWWFYADRSRTIVWPPEPLGMGCERGGDDPEARLCRAVLAVLEPDPDAGLEVREEVEERLLRTLETPREGLLSPEEAWRRHEEAPGDYRRARGASPLPEGAEMPEETIRRLRDREGEAAP